MIVKVFYFLFSPGHNRTICQILSCHISLNTDLSADI